MNVDIVTEHSVIVLLVVLICRYMYVCMCVWVGFLLRFYRLHYVSLKNVIFLIVTTFFAETFIVFGCG